MAFGHPIERFESTQPDALSSESTATRGHTVFGIKSSSQIIGLDISSTSVKLLELTRQRGGLRVESYAVEPLPVNSVNEKTIQDIEAVGEAVRRAVKKSGTKATRAAVAVSGSAVITKIISMPANLNDREMEMQIHLEAEQHIPYSINDVNVDFQVMGETAGQADKVDVLLAATKTENIEDRVTTLKMAGLKPAVVDIEPYTIEHSIEMLTGGDENLMNGTVAVIDVGATMTSLNVMQDRQLIYTREQAFGGKLLTEEIMRRYGLSYQDAGRAKRVGGLPEGYEQDVLAPFKQSIAQHINRYLQFYYSSSQDTQVDEIILAGGSSSIEDIDNYIQDQIGTPTSIAQPFNMVDLAKGVDRERLVQDGPAMMIACGLALRGVE